MRHTAGSAAKRTQGRVCIHCLDRAIADWVVADVRKVGKIMANLENVDLSNFNHRIRNGKTVYDVQFQIRVIFGAQEGILKFEAHSHGQLIGATSINFAHTRSY